MPFDREESEDRASFSRRAVLAGAAQTVLFGLIGARLYQLQVVEGETFALIADENRISVRLLAPMRGEVRDRFGRVVATNEPELKVLVVPERAADLGVTLERIGRIVDLAPETAGAVIDKARRQPRFYPITVADDLTWDEFARLNVHLLHLPGAFTEVGWRRRYPLGPVFAHVSGYVGAVSEEEFDGDGALRLPGFAIGKTGIEKVADRTLRGEAGTVKVEIEASGRVVRELERRPPRAGTEVVLTVDHDVQAYALERLEGQSGAVVVMDVNTGDVLALASSPGFDPRVFERGTDAGEWRKLSVDASGPLANRAVAGQYPPGSTYKLVTALAALAEEDTDPEEEITCLGAVTLGNKRFRCWRRGGHGPVAFHDAIKRSCDVYFYRTGERIGIDAIARMARRLGFEDELPFADAKRGVVPDEAWKKRAIGEPWYGGETLIAAIGQGYVLTTPLQLAVMTARIANGRFKIRPRFVRPLAGEPEVPEFEPLDIPQGHIRRVCAGMRAVVNEKGGTATRSRLDIAGIEMAGKTGTSQVISSRGPSSGAPDQEDHALFVAFAPVIEPRYAVAVVIEHGGGGSRVAAPVAHDVMTHVIERRVLARAPYDGTNRPEGEDGDGGQTVARG
jgi:penicillin-binding protein 2